MVKFTHMSNYSDLMGFTIFKCGSGKQIPQKSASSTTTESHSYKRGFPTLP